MSQIIISVIAFIVAIGILVAFHEFGHFWVARKLGVKVLRYSIGFGKPVLGFRRAGDPTEYVVSAIPLGGYVKMLDEREGEVQPHERHMAFNNQPKWSRLAIVTAGPLFNVILAVVFFTLVYLIGIQGVKPIVGDVIEQSYAQNGGFESGDRLIEVAGRPVRTWQEVRLAILDVAINQSRFETKVVDRDGVEKNKTIDLMGTPLLKNEGDLIERLGFHEWRPKIDAVIGEVQPNSAAERAGLRVGDRVLSANDEKIDSFEDWADFVRQRPEQVIDLAVLRDGAEVGLVLVPDRIAENNLTIGRAGVYPLVPDGFREQRMVVVQYPIFESIVKGVEKTRQMTLLTFRLIGKLLIGEASIKNISGPIAIADYAGKSVTIGLNYFLELLAIISVSLAVLNILPVPLLDGGHVLYIVIEWIKGSPLSERAQVIGQNFGILLLGTLMMLAFYNDISRYLG